MPSTVDSDGYPEIPISPHKLEAHFVFFYDFRCRIVRIETTTPVPSTTMRTFVRRNPRDSELSQFYFSDGFPDKMVALHFHGTTDSVPGGSRFEVANGGHRFEFELSSRPPDVGQGIESYGFLECTLFRNGILAVTLRLQNLSPLSARAYAELIARPEYVSRGGPHPGAFRPGRLVEAVWDRISIVEQNLASYLSGLEIHAMTLGGGEVKPLEVRPDSGSAAEGAPASGETEEGDLILHTLRRSRPYIGTIAKIPPRDDDRFDVQRFSIACARTTPEFLKTFVNPNRYLHGDDPRRNIYYPGPSIVLIGRRGWSCIQREERGDKVAFWLGVVETVLFVVQAMLGSTRATRRFLTTVIEEGARAGADLNAGTRIDGGGRLFSGLNPSKIREFSDFIARARINSPLDDMSTLLSCHLTTHTGIAAVHRVARLTEHRDLVENARNTLANFSAFLEGPDQYWKEQNDKRGVGSLRLAAAALIVGIIGFVAGRCAIG